ncbi:hypothetical protein OIE63_09295 [Streptomyces sp. NBC_01795]|uniref:hypothetical protein n=1 Tax=unclassified Streptomyces TaxID=2593676 RepID=UPI002DD7AD05|nr:MULTISPECIES: hypothetical protein [unclassified Streptomyces]WSA91731.1 hypothetical protein OIE63_09295 [Streptomyces sp. NBC_01795]WSS15625.1 hypothetical protein OG533_29830 [Streptomyces sp. NBC_01186]
MSDKEPELAAPKSALKLITKGINDSLDELQELGMVGQASVGRGFSDVALTGMQLGHEGLTSAFGDFCDRWEWGVRALIQEGNSFAEGVGLAGGAVHQQDQYIQGTFKVAVNAGMGNPYATEEEITGKDWGEVLSNNAYTQIRDADYSKESFQTARENSVQAWKNTAWDVSTATSSPAAGLVDAAGLRDDLNDGMRETFGPSPEEQQQAAARAQSGSRPPAGER